MNISILGSGNVATYLGLALHKVGRNIQQVYSPQLVNAAILARKIASKPVDSLAKIEPVDVFIIAVKDNAFQFFQDLDILRGKTLIHCSGSNRLEIFENLSDKLGVIWPLYSIQKDNLPITRDIPLVLDATTPILLNVVERIALSASDNIHHLSNDARSYLHLNAVLVNNFSNHLFALAEQICIQQHIDFQILKPIIAQGVANVAQGNLLAKQTGPAIRNDFSTISKHLEMLQSMGLSSEVYQSLTQSIIQFKN
jgi:predicted short-subunit dehydrogenase-like oxidoreductase (DUF2520 family)